MTTLTYQPDQGQPEFSEEELDSIAVGERMAAEQETLLAGKYQSAEELEKAYVELQQKFSGQQSQEQPQEEVQQEEQQSTEDFDLLDTLWNEANSEWTQGTLEALSKADPVDIAQAYLEQRAENNANNELSAQEIQSLYEVVGGEEQYGQMMQWAASNLPNDQQQLFDSVINKGDMASCFFAVQALAFRMAESAGWESQDFLTGTDVVQTRDAFRSQAEVVAAMQDPRYDNDPAYRQDVMNKLARSDDLMY